MAKVVITFEDSGGGTLVTSEPDINELHRKLAAGDQAGMSQAELMAATAWGAVLQVGERAKARGGRFELGSIDDEKPKH